VEQIDYSDRGTALTGWLARPSGAPRAAVAVFPTIMNTTPAVEAKALALTDAGYLAFVADFYGEPVPDFATSQALSKALVADPDHFRRRLHAALTAMGSLNGAAGLPQAAIGFCMGGMAVLDLARDGADLLAVASFHGLLETARKADQPIKPRILVCHGDADALVPRSHVLAFWEEMDAAGANWHFHSYSGVHHGFTNPNRSPATGTVSYDPSADRQSWAAMLGLFDEVLAAQ
jgi:dienelactone hydrolase